jgi:hypothetical protein
MEGKKEIGNHQKIHIGSTITNINLGNGGGGNDMETRIAVLENDVTHIREDIGEIKSCLRSINHDIKDLGSRTDQNINSLSLRVNSGYIKLFKEGVIATAFVLTAMAGLYSMIDSSVDKKIDSFEKTVSYQFSEINESIKDLK